MSDTPKSNEPWRGADRRKLDDRRTLHDRREMIRFEPEKDDRRSGKDRRDHGVWDPTRAR